VIRKNKKFIDPRYFMNEMMELHEVDPRRYFSPTTDTRTTPGLIGGIKSLLSTENGGEPAAAAVENGGEPAEGAVQLAPNDERATGIFLLLKKQMQRETDPEQIKHLKVLKNYVHHQTGIGFTGENTQAEHALKKAKWEATSTKPWFGKEMKHWYAGEILQDPEEDANTLTENDYEEERPSDAEIFRRLANDLRAHYEEKRMPDAEIFRRLANDLRALDSSNEYRLDQVVDLLNRQKDFKGAWDQLLRDEEYEESSSYEV